jgi:hypothetical protein
VGARGGGAGGSAVKRQPYRRPGRMGKTLTRAFVWVILAIFILTSVGVTLFSFSSR